MVSAVFDGLSERSRFLRYHTPVPRLTGPMGRYLSAVRAGEHEVLVAEVRGRPVGLARWIRDPERPELAEFSVEVVDDFHRRGIGGSLLRLASDTAAACGITALRCHVHPENTVMHAWLGRRGAPRRYVNHSAHDDGPVYQVPTGSNAGASRGTGPGPDRATTPIIRLSTELSSDEGRLAC